MKKLVLGFALSLFVLGMAACSSENTATNKEEVKSDAVKSEEAATVSKDAIELEGEDLSYNQNILSNSEKVKGMSESEIKHVYTHTPIEEHRGEDLATDLIKHALGTQDAVSDYLTFLKTYTGEGYVEYTTKTKEVSDKILEPLNKAVSKLEVEDPTMTLPIANSDSTVIKETGENKYSYDLEIELANPYTVGLPTYKIHLETVFNPEIDELQAKSITVK